MKTVIMPIGTSLITNYLDEDKNNDIYKEVKQLDEKYKENKNVRDEVKKNSKKYLSSFFESSLNSCAEKVSIAKIKKEFGDDLKIILIVSDTKISKFLGEEIFKEYFENCEIECIEGLQIEDKEKFEKDGLHNFVEFFKELKPKDTIFNITAGYKAFIPYLTIIGQLHNIPIRYIFEDSQELISIPQLPIGFDDKIADLYLPYLNNFILAKTQTPQKVKLELKKYGFIKDNKLTIFGELFKDYMNHKTSSLGDLMEYLLLGIYIKEKDISLEKSKKYTIDGKKGDIDLIIKKENSIEFIEVKSFGQFVKFKDEQLTKYLNYILQEYQNSGKKITILFYILNENLLEEYIDDFKIIKSELSDKKVTFSVKYIEVRPENFINFIREFDKKEIKEFNYE
jgi:CRISPR/Cas system-associated protein Csm6